MIPRLFAVLLVLVVGVGACVSDPEPTTTTSDPAEAGMAFCDLRVEALLQQAQRFVDGFADAPLGDLSERTAPGARWLADNIAETRRSAEQDGCDMEAFDAALDRGIESLTGSGPVGRRVAMALRGEDPLGLPPAELELEPADDLPGALLGLGPGSTVRLTAGIFELDELLLIDRAVTITGAGADSTILRSSSAGASVLVASSGPVAIGSVGIEYTGEGGSSVLVAVAGDLELRSMAVSGGVADAETGADGHGIALVGREGEQRRLTLTEVVSEGNENVGVAILGAAEVQIDDGAMTGNGFCGVCLIQASGTVDVVGTSASDNQLGVGVSGSASATLTGVTLEGNDVAGLLVEDQSMATLVDPTIADNGNTGVEIVDETAVSISGAEIVGHDRGVAIGGSAVVTMRETEVAESVIGVVVGEEGEIDAVGVTVRDSGELGIAAIDQSSGRFEDSVVEGGSAGLRLADATTVAFVGGELTGSGGVGLLALGAAAGSLETSTVSGYEIGAQLGGETTSVIDGNRFEAGGASGMLFAGSSRADVRSNRISGFDVGYQLSEEARPNIVGGSVLGGSAGILALGDSRGTIENVTVEGSDVGALVDGRSALAITGLSAVGVGSAGLVYRSNGGGTASGVSVSTSGGDGVRIVGSAAPTLRSLTIAGAGTGVLVAGTARPRLIGGRVNATLPLRVAESAVPQVAGVTLAASGRTAIEYSGRAAGSLDDLTVDGGTEVGIEIKGYASPSIARSLIGAVGPIGIAITELSAPALRENTIRGLEVGIQVIDGASPVVIGNRFESVTSVAVLFLGSVSGTVSGNICPAGIPIITFGGSVDIGDNQCEVSGL